MDFALARENMVAGQLKPNNVHNAALLARFASVPRELFVESGMRNLCYMDDMVLMGSGRYMFSAKVAARLIQELEIQPDDNILVAASGTGYSAVLVAPHAKKTTAIEENALLVDVAKKNTSEASCGELSWVTGKPEKGYAKNAPYNKILVDAAVETIPEALVEQLANGGRLVAVVKTADNIFHATVFSKQGKKLVEKQLFECRGQLLDNFKKAEEFVF